MAIKIKHTQQGKNGFKTTFIQTVGIKEKKRK